MKLSVAALSFASLASAITVSYDVGYDDASRSMNVVACSDGPNGLVTKYGWQTQGAIPRHPYIGGYMGVAGWNSPQCGTCYSLTYNGKSVYILAVDRADGFNIAKGAMDDLTNGQSAVLGRVEAQYAQVPVNNCGL
ncbi:hypothetical protein J1614_008358 [Plenodomus biglobosus]|nr:hypothetical protein J1614_008358 [Plenodomus biglobosus]